MNFVRKAASALGCVFLGVLLMASLAPKATHALAAALVQIVPGTTTHVGQNESQLVSLICSHSSTCTAVDSSGNQSGTPYVVPTGMTLIVTDYEWGQYGASANLMGSDSFYNSATGNGYGVMPMALADKEGNVSEHEHYQSGIRIASGVTLADENAYFSVGFASIRGYLVPND